MKKTLCLIGLLLMTRIQVPAAVPETVFDVKAVLSTPLNPRTLTSTETNGIVTEEVMFHSEMDGEKNVEIFALFSYPKGARGLPAFVWNQGGLARASTYFPEIGARRGYAVLCIDFPMPGYRSTGGYHISSGLDLTDDPRQAPIYHGAVALLKAVSYLESRPEVNRDRIGMAGSSWGGFYTTLMAGLDPRLKAGSAMFGTGSLQLGNRWWDGKAWDEKRDAAFRERWRTTLDPAWRLQNVQTPMGWFTGTNDSFYWMPALMQSHEMAAGPKHLSLLPNWDHGLTGSVDEQVFAWLDVHLKGQPAFLRVTPIRLVKQGSETIARWSFQGAREAVSAEVILSYGDAGNWPRRYWITIPAQLKDDACTVKLPACDTPYFISGTVIDKDEFRYSTPLLRVAPTDFIPGERKAIIAYDGCAMWGGFEENQVRYVQAHGWACPAISQDAKEGRQSAQLQGGGKTAGKTILPPIFFTAGVPHRFVCHLKGAKPVQVTVEIGGNFDGKPVAERKEFSIGTAWTEISLDFTPPPVLSTDLRATITLLDGATVLADAVSFRPNAKR